MYTGMFIDTLPCMARTKSIQLRDLHCRVHFCIGLGQQPTFSFRLPILPWFFFSFFFDKGPPEGGGGGVVCVFVWGRICPNPFFFFQE